MYLQKNKNIFVNITSAYTRLAMQYQIKSININK
jgi:hypothetical protein